MGKRKGHPPTPAPPAPVWTANCPTCLGLGWYLLSAGKARCGWCHGVGKVPG